jgi:NAD(P)-dependent dehydrogenase (short-subunit alcohol dehydrogenase family)
MSTWERYIIRKIISVSFTNGGPMSRKLSGRTALISGASAWIGWASALAWAGEGANLVLTRRRQAHRAELESAVQAAGGKAVSWLGDAKEEDCVVVCQSMFGQSISI